MAKKKGHSAVKDEKSSKYVLKKVVWGSVFGIAAFFVLFAVFAAVLLKGGVKQSLYPFIALGISALAAFVSGFAAVRPIRRNGILLGIFSSIPIIVVIIAALLITNRGDLGFFTLMMIPLMLLTGAVGGIVSVNMRRLKR